MINECPRCYAKLVIIEKLAPIAYCIDPACDFETMIDPFVFEVYQLRKIEK